ncbi:hypothetical protein OF829_19285 [Sphingomonas sp. LB-2]|uniref:hypothetical protein n=1 Tax=Sphingomonas caeni TaxID=2984949 RepID=UPI002231051D|nr:hypothetical protein [Sphingomonas caeni]MCW3849389.1 hypothetical protein [Sphingomonas caeni]
MIGLTIAILMAAPPQDVAGRCRSIALRIERTSRIAVTKLETHYASEPQAARDAAFLRRVGQVRTAQVLARAIRARYPGNAARNATVDAMAWNDVVAAGEACRDRRD